ncbi:penicillin-binding transpeptidase domain-containing protein [Psychromicrobium sp. YIM B11713]|uniref:penicillin-binding transpeptidase domain-containing protein n=1 Tax=Psychromicrobium sp. YIM B11713 TaxID=3145233 RepID=UPI00374EB728
MRTLKTLALALPAVLLAITLSSCDGGDNGAKAAAQKLVDALNAEDFAGVNFADGVSADSATDSFKKLVKPLGDLKPKVSLGSVEPDKDNKDKVTATLNYAWDFDAGSWQYNNTARLTRNDKNWSTPWSAQLVIPNFTEGNELQLQSAPAQRGKILGDGGQVLVEDRPVLSVGIDKTKVPAADQAASAQALATLVKIDPAAYAKQVKDSGPQAFVEAIVLRDDADRTVTDQQISAIAGAVALKQTLPLAPSRSFARAVLGTVGPATAELIEKSKGRLKVGDITGLSGLQAQYDQQLAGTPGIQVVEKDPKAAAGTDPRVLFSTEAKAGADLKTTLNLKAQNLAESVLADSTTAASVVAIRPSTGAIIAAANSPGSNGYDTAFLGQYAPGSTFKTVTSLALIRKGMTPESIVSCEPLVYAGGTSFKNEPYYPQAHTGQIPLKDAFAHSCNTAFVSNAQKLTQQDLASAAASLGIGAGAESELGIDGFPGNVKLSGTDAEHAASMIGQGTVLASPWTMAGVAASVSHGSLVKPKLVERSPDSSAQSSTTPSATPSSSSTGAATPVIPLSAAEVAALKEMMAAVVTSGHAAVLQNLPGGAVIAKTGTAEYGNEKPPKTHAWMIAAQGDLAIAVFVDDGGFGAGTAGPIAAKFITGMAAK